MLRIVNFLPRFDDEVLWRKVGSNQSWTDGPRLLAVFVVRDIKCYQYDRQI